MLKRGRELSSASSRGKYLHTSFGILVNCTLVSPHLYLHSYGLVYLLYALGYDPVLRHLFGYSKCLSFGHWELLQAGCVPEQALSYCFSAYFLTFWCNNMLQFVLSSPCSRPRIGHLPKESCFLVLWKSMKKPRSGHWGGLCSSEKQPSWFLRMLKSEDSHRGESSTN